MKTRYLLKRITAMILLAVLCLQPVEFAFAQAIDELAEDVLEQPAEQPVDEPADVPVDEPVDELAEEQAEKQIEESPAGVTLIYIEVTKLPAKTEYLCTDTAVDPAGGILTLAYSDGSTETVELSSASLSALSDDAGEVSVTASYEGMTASFAVSVSHSYDDGVVTTEPTATEAGVMTYTCVNCGDEQTSEIPMAVSDDIGGTIGIGLAWMLSADGVLTVSGSGTMPEYLDADAPWDDYKDNIKKIVIEDGVNNISNGAFGGCTALTEIVMPNVKQIGKAAFSGCNGLEKIVIPDSISSIGDNAFAYCTNLKEAVLSENMSYVEVCLFANCSALTSVTIPSGIEQIFENAFLQCKSLESLTIPDTVKGIDVRAFYGCSGIETIRFEGDAPDISGNAFYSVTATAYYDAGKNWTDNDFQNYGGTITWKAIGAAEERYITDITRITLEDINDSEGYFDGSQVVLGTGGWDGRVFIDVQAQLDSMAKDDDGYYWLEGVIVTAPSDDAVTCYVEAFGLVIEDPDAVGERAFTKIFEGINVVTGNGSSGSKLIGFSIPFTDAVVKNLHDDNYGRFVEIEFVWKDANGNTVAHEFTRCWINKVSEFSEPVPITDTDRIVLEDIYDPYNYFEDSYIEVNGDDTVYVYTYAKLDYMIPDEDGFYWMDGVIVIPPNNDAVTCDIEAVGTIYIDEDPYVEEDFTWTFDNLDVVAGNGSSGNKLVGFSIPFNENMVQSLNPDVRCGVILYFTWKDGDGKTIAYERSFAHIVEKNVELAPITDISRITTENVADYELFEGSKEKTDSDGNVFIDMKAQLDYLLEDEKGYRWMHDVNVVLPDDIEEIASCTVTAEGVINGEIGWSVSYDQYRIDLIPNKDKYLIGISIPFKDDVLHKDDSSDYRNVEVFLEWKDSSGNILAVERFYCEITKAEAAAVEGDFIYDPSRFTIDRDDNFTGSFVSQYPDGVVVLDMRAKVNNLYKDTDGYFRTVAMTLSGGPAEAVYCDVTAEGVLHPDTLYTNTDGYGVTNGTVTFTVPFTEEVVLGENLSGGVNLKFAWKDRYGRAIKSESACCEIVETFSYINDTSRFSLAGVGLDFAGSRVEQYEGAYDNSVYLSINADTDVLTPDEYYYYIPDVELKAPKGATFAQVIFLGFDDRGCIYEETFTGSVYNGLLTMNIPFTKDVMGNMEYGGNRIEMRIRWMDSGRNFMQHERAFCVFETQSKYIDDVWRFEIVNALELPGVMSSSKVVQYPDGVVCLDMKVDMDEMELGQDDFYWLYDIILTAPSDEAVSCDIDHIGVRNRETIFHGRMTDKEVVEHNGNRFIGFNTHFVEELLCTDRNYGNVELHFTWKDKNGSELLREIAYMEVSESEGFDNIDGLKADWYEVNIPESLRDSVTVHKQDGLVTITVGEATAEQWAQAYLAGEPEATTIIASIHVTGPADAEYYYDVQGGMEYESYMERTAPDSDGWRIGRESGNGEAIAQIVVDEDGYTFVPMGNMEYGSKHRYLAWKNANNEVTRAILQQNIVVAEGVDKVEVGTDILPLPAYPEANRISYQGNDWFTDAQYNAENGTVTFNCTLAEGQNAETLKAAIAEDNSQGNVTVWVKPPEGYDKVRTSWGHEFIVGEVGVYDFGHTYWYWEDWEKGIITLDTGSRTVTVTWLSSVDLSLPPIRETITIRYNFNGMYWMDKYWQPVPVERIKLPTIAGLTFDVVDGGIHTRVDGDVIPDAEKLRYAEAVITPPKGARGLKFNHSGGTATADYSDRMAEEQDRLVRTSHVGRLADGRRSLINIKELEVDGVTVVFNERLGGEDVSIFDWYDNARCEGEPILREYIWQTEDALLYTSESDSVENEEDIKEPVKKPTLVGAKGWKLKLHRYPQKNENREHAFYFRLEIKNGKGDSEGPGDKKWVVYLPFDFLGEGVDTLDEAMNKVKGNKKITINHYDENHNCIEVIEGKITKNGIRFKAKSFSPLMVSVEEGGSAAAYVSMVFDSMGGTPVESVNQILIGSTVQLPEPEKDGYDLVGWFTEPECGCELECGCVKYTSETPVLENVTLYARWARASVAVPNASIASGTIVAPGTKVSLMAQGDDVSICYSIGVTGFMESDAKLYGEPIEITEDTTINAIARMDGYEDSEVVTFTYTVEQPDNSTGDVLPEDMPTTPGEAIPEGIWVSRMADLTYDGTAQKPAFRLYDGNKLLEEKVDYTVSYKNNTKAAEADVSNLKLSPHIIVKMKGNYTGEIIIPFTIKPVELNADDFTVSIPAQAETGKALTPKPTVTWNKTGKAIKLNTDYTIEHSECKEPGKYSVTIKGAGNFEGVLAAEFIVANKTEQVLMSKVSVASIKAQNWEKIDGGIKPELLVTYKAEEKDEATGKNLLYEGVDYTVEWVNNDRVGTASVILTGTGEDSDDDGIVYVGSVTKTFKINGIAMSKVTVNNVAKAGYEYTGSEIRPTEFASDPMTLTYQADKKKPETWKDLTENTHYTVEYQKNVAKGTGTVIFTGKEEAGYTGTKKQTFKINAAQLNADTAVVNIDTCAYTAGGAVPSMLVMWKSGEGDVSLVPGVDYTVSFKNNKAVYEDDLANAKKAPSVTIKGKGNFAGTIVEYFHISPKLLDENCGVTVVAADKVDTGKAGGWQQSFKVYDSNGKALSAGKDYEKTAEYRLIAVPDSNGVLLRADRRLDKTSVVRPGSVIKVTVRGVGSYQGCVSGTYRILEKGYDIKSATIQIKDQLYTGKEIRITDQNQFVEGKVFIKVGKESIPLELGKDIQVVSYEKNLNKGSAKVTFAGVGKFGGTKTVTFKIIGYAVN